jgi:hypothetical protein
MLSGVIALLTMGDGRERPHASPDEPQQEVNELRLRVLMRDALLTKRVAGGAADRSDGTFAVCFLVFRRRRDHGSCAHSAFS